MVNWFLLKYIINKLVFIIKWVAINLCCRWWDKIFNYKMEMGSEFLKNTSVWRRWYWRTDDTINYKMLPMVLKMINLAKSGPTEKVDGSWFFDPNFDIFDENRLYRDLWKNSPHNKHCAWARTPPWAKTYNLLKNHVFLRFWAFNRAGKTVSHVGIYALPPPREEPFSGNFRKISIFVCF
jgi:hypothetical protein